MKMTYRPVFTRSCSFPGPHLGLINSDVESCNLTGISLRQILHKDLVYLLNNLAVVIIHRTDHGGSERANNLRLLGGGKIWVQTQAHLSPKHGSSVPPPRYLQQPPLWKTLVLFQAESGVNSAKVAGKWEERMLSLPCSHLPTFFLFSFLSSSFLPFLSLFIFFPAVLHGF